MGYSHYYHHIRSITREEWAEAVIDVKGILGDIQHNQNVALADGMGDAGTQPIITDELICFNGLGDQSCESLTVFRRRPPKEDRDWFCKTYEKPYDLAVVAVLAYFDTVVGSHSVTSDGSGADWLDGVEEVRRGAPRCANKVDIPREILRQDRWAPIYIKNASRKYNFRFCIDGKAYIYRVSDEEAYVFPTHHEAAEWAAPYLKELFRPSGSFDAARNQSIMRGQTALLGRKFEAREWSDGRSGRPPALARPNQFPPLEVENFDLRSFLKEKTV